MGGCCGKRRPNTCSSMKREDEGGGGGEGPEELFVDGEVGDDGARRGDGGERVWLEGSSGFASMYSRQGRKGVNQDAMTLWENFTGDKDTIFCGVFDGHGPFGHKVARHVRDVLPAKLSSEYKSLQQPGGEQEEGLPATFSEEGGDGDGGRGTDSNPHPWFSPWEASFFRAFKEMDEELGHGSRIDCICSGTTAVSVVKQKDHLIIANLGDSRAVLCTRDDRNQLVPVQLTVDLKPNLPNEARRITSCQGRVFALEEEPEVHRLWLPDENCPGLAMARAFGDFCLKQFGLISTPEVTYRKLTEKDDFVVLATDGVWDVLSNKEVVKIVSSCTRKRSRAAKHLVDRAVRTWEEKLPSSNIDDCAVICLFLKPTSSSPNGSGPAGARGGARRKPRSRQLSIVESFKTARSAGEVSEYFDSTNAADDDAGEDWTALEGVCRANSLMQVPRIAGLLSGGSREREKAEEDGS